MEKSWDRQSDPFDEFEFKPLTDGLGFHRKSVQSKLPEIQDDDISFDRVLTSPLQRSETKSTPAQIPAAAPNSTAVDDILKSLSERRKYGFKENEAAKVLHAPVEIQFKPTRWDLSASLLDAMLIVATYLACLIILLLVTQVDLFANIYNADEQGMIYLSLATLFAGITWIYLVTTRVFMGYTPGEWVFDQRLGKPEEVGTAGYSIRVAARSFLVLATGLVTLPFLSLVIGKDYIGRLLGVELLKKV